MHRHVIISAVFQLLIPSSSSNVSIQKHRGEDLEPSPPADLACLPEWNFLSLPLDLVPYKWIDEEFTTLNETKVQQSINGGRVRTANFWTNVSRGITEIESLLEGAGATWLLAKLNHTTSTIIVQGPNRQTCNWHVLQCLSRLEPAIKLFRLDLQAKVSICLVQLQARLTSIPKTLLKPEPERQASASIRQLSGDIFESFHRTASCIRGRMETAASRPKWGLHLLRLVSGCLTGQ
ncbi:uncharacterized protein LOC129757337 [Uranotaenia lowii]|uniref:uncharacterized protein LOC129757337 n=1 Tax=Uranotaenia lowii TaxID=190385 RepID=UPI00247AEB4A|nr:uncharacterized protein LOC129757337 [Uranotaenia lowii]XP_055610613.1 uncharacterized protein LOC129757337 [Uranotaenia lowii]